jgi:hypothetical protein
MEVLLAGAVELEAPGPDLHNSVARRTFIGQDRRSLRLK